MIQSEYFMLIHKKIQRSFWGIASLPFRKAPAKWFENTLDFPSEEILLGYRLRSPLPPGEKPCPLSLAHGFLHTQPPLMLSFS
jgi:hypothetical protein